MSFELVKIVCVAVIAERDGDSIVGEQESPQKACYSNEELVEYRSQILGEIAAKNAELAAVPNRAARRRSKPKRSA
jgi:hypothetical protein